MPPITPYPSRRSANWWSWTPAAATRKKPVPKQRAETNIALRGPTPIEPAAEDRRREAQEDDGDAEHPAQGAELPVAVHGLGDAERLAQRQVEDAEGIGLADRKMNRQGCGRDEPTVEAWGCDGPAAVEERESGHGRSPVKDDDAFLRRGRPDPCIPKARPCQARSLLKLSPFTPADSPIPSRTAP